jgi:hypothetical protein
LSGREREEKIGFNKLKNKLSMGKSEKKLRALK